MNALPSVEVLEVDRIDGSLLLVPLVRDCIRSIDLEARRIDIDLGFLGEELTSSRSSRSGSSGSAASGTSRTRSRSATPSTPSTSVPRRR